MLFGYPFLCDANIHGDVVQHLLDRGCDVCTIEQLGMATSNDGDILATAYQQKRVVVTHDRDFGTLAVLQEHPLIGIAYLRPGHIDPLFTIETLQAISVEKLTLTPPFILVAHRSGSSVRIRVRSI